MRSHRTAHDHEILPSIWNCDRKFKQSPLIFSENKLFRGKRSFWDPFWFGEAVLCLPTLSTPKVRGQTSMGLKGGATVFSE